MIASELIVAPVLLVSVTSKTLPAVAVGGVATKPLLYQSDCPAFTTALGEAPIASCPEIVPEARVWIRVSAVPLPVISPPAPVRVNVDHDVAGGCVVKVSVTVPPVSEIAAWDVEVSAAASAKALRQAECVRKVRDVFIGLGFAGFPE